MFFLLVRPRPMVVQPWIWADDQSVAVAPPVPVDDEGWQPPVVWPSAQVCLSFAEEDSLARVLDETDGPPLPVVWSAPWAPAPLWEQSEALPPAPVGLDDTALPVRMVWPDQARHGTLGDVDTLPADADPTRYILQDRVLATQYALRVTATEYSFTPISAVAAPEPVLLDHDDGVTHRRLFIANGDVGYEVTADPLLPLVIEDQDVPGVFWTFFIHEGTLSYAVVGGVVGDEADAPWMVPPRWDVPFTRLWHWDDPVLPIPGLFGLDDTAWLPPRRWAAQTVRLVFWAEEVTPPGLFGLDDTAWQPPLWWPVPWGSAPPWEQSEALPPLGLEETAWQLPVVWPVTPQWLTQHDTEELPTASVLFGLDDTAWTPPPGWTTTPPLWPWTGDADTLVVVPGDESPWSPPRPLPGSATWAMPTRRLWWDEADALPVAPVLFGLDADPWYVLPPWPVTAQWWSAQAFRLVHSAAALDTLAIEPVPGSDQRIIWRNAYNIFHRSFTP